MKLTRTEQILCTAARTLVTSKRALRSLASGSVGTDWAWHRGSLAAAFVVLLVHLPYVDSAMRRRVGAVIRLGLNVGGAQ